MSTESDYDEDKDQVKDKKRNQENLVNTVQSTKSFELVNIYLSALVNIQIFSVNLDTFTSLGQVRSRRI